MNQKVDKLFSNNYFYPVLKFKQLEISICYVKMLNYFQC